MTATNDWGVKARELLGQRGIAVDENAAQRAAQASELIAAAMRACDHHGDGPEARDQMGADCIATPTQKQADLLAHFIQTYEAEL